MEHYIKDTGDITYMSELILDIYLNKKFKVNLKDKFADARNSKRRQL
jgi:hypothetical protein